MKLDLTSLRDALAALEKSLGFLHSDMAKDASLVQNVARYKTYREKRDITSHTYDENKAESIVAVLGEFRDDIRYLLAGLEKRNLETH